MAAFAIDICTFDHTIRQSQDTVNGNNMASSSLSEFQSVPIIDVAPLFDGSRDGARAVAAEIRQASIEVGFFYVRGHNVTQDLMQDMLDAAKAFFVRPEERKREIQVNKAHRGYVPFAQTTLGRAYKPDLKESLNFAFPFEADDPYRKDNKPLIGVNQWPADDAPLKQIAEAYYAGVF